MIKLVILIFLLVSVTLIESVPEIKRQLQSTVNPGCSKSTKCQEEQAINMVYTKAIGNDDVIHYIWSSIGAPTSLIVQTSNASELQVDWDKLLNGRDLSGAITFTETPYYSFGVIISKLIEFDDEENSASLNQKNITINTIPTEDLTWEKVNIHHNDSSHCSAIFSTTNASRSEIYEENGIIMIQMDVHGNDDHDDTLPQLPFNSNSTQIRIFLKKLVPNFKKSRFGLRIITVATEHIENGNFSSITFDTINDEYTPGVFKSVQMVSPGSTAGFGSYLNWKPVSYTSEDFTVIESSDVHLYQLDEDLLDNLPYSIAKAFFTSKNNIMINKFNVTFGTEDDGFYKKRNYVAWSFISGIGKPINEKFSLLVIMVITSGLGLPTIIMLSSTVYICFHKYRKNKLETSKSAPLNFN